MIAQNKVVPVDFSQRLLPFPDMEMDKPTGLPSIESIPAKGLLLQRCRGRDDTIRTLDLTPQCPFQFGFGLGGLQSPNFKDGKVYLIANAAEKLQTELAGTLTRPNAVQICPQGDPFPPFMEIQKTSAKVAHTLAEYKIQSWFLTRGFIRPAIVENLLPISHQVKLVVQINTLERNVQRSLEPLTAPPKLRLKQIRNLKSLGLHVQVALEPMLPGITDRRENLRHLLEALADCGIQRVSAGYLALPMDSQENLQELLEELGWASQVFSAYFEGPIFRTGQGSKARYLPKSRRQQGYATLMTLAAKYGISVSISTISNPDFAQTVSRNLN